MPKVNLNTSSIPNRCHPIALIFWTMNAHPSTSKALCLHDKPRMSAVVPTVASSSFGS